MGVSPACELGISGLAKDDNFQYRNTSLINQCYMRYQNSMGESVVSCRQWEYEDFCAQYNFGRICLVSTGFVEIPFCTPHKCTTEADYTYILSTFFRSSSSKINCELVKQTESVLVPALVSTVVILLLSVFLVFAVRPPKHIRESTKLIKAQASLTSLSSSSSSSL